jgi:hypothetical protein
VGDVQSIGAMQLVRLWDKMLVDHDFDDFLALEVDFECVFFEGSFLCLKIDIDETFVVLSLMQCEMTRVV